MAHTILKAEHNNQTKKQSPASVEATMKILSYLSLFGAATVVSRNTKGAKDGGTKMPKSGAMIDCSQFSPGDLIDVSSNPIQRSVAGDGFVQGGSEAFSPSGGVGAGCGGQGVAGVDATSWKAFNDAIGNGAGGCSGGDNFNKFTMSCGPGAGIIHTPNQLDPTFICGLRLSTGNDCSGRDPLSYVLEGTNDGGVTWTEISSGDFSVGAADDVNDDCGGDGCNVQTARCTVGEAHMFSSPVSSFRTYRIRFPEY